MSRGLAGLGGQSRRPRAQTIVVPCVPCFVFRCVEDCSPTTSFKPLGEHTLQLTACSAFCCTFIGVLFFNIDTRHLKLRTTMKVLTPMCDGHH